MSAVICTAQLDPITQSGLTLRVVVYYADTGLAMYGFGDVPEVVQNMGGDNDGPTGNYLFGFEVAPSTSFTWKAFNSADGRMVANGAFTTDADGNLATAANSADVARLTELLDRLLRVVQTQ